MSETTCERCGRSIILVASLFRCPECGRAVCGTCIPLVEELYKSPGGKKERKKYVTRPRPCWDCLAARITQSGCDACASYHPGRTPCDQCPLPLDRRDIGSEQHLRLVHRAVIADCDVPPLSRLWHVFVHRTWEGSQRGRGLNPVDDRPDVRAVKLPVDELAARLAALGLAFCYDVTQSSVTALAELKTGPVLNICDVCGGVARGGSTYGWSWGPEGTSCPYHRDVNLPPRPDNWMELINAPLESDLWQAALQGAPGQTSFGFVPGKGSAHDYVPSWVQIPPLYTEGQDAPYAVVKWFTPDAGWTWYVIEYDPAEGVAFALCVGPQDTELGYVSLGEIREVRGPLGLRVERDLWFTPTPVVELPEYRAKWGDGGPYHRPPAPAEEAGVVPDAETEPSPEAATQAESPRLPPRWTEEDIRFLLARLDAGPILVSDPALGIPTIHDPSLRDARHVGFGVFVVETPDYTVGFEAGGALQRTPGGQGWCYLTIKQGCFPYDTEAVRRTLRTWLGEEPAIPRVLEDTSSRALALLYRDWLSVTNGDESAYPSEQRLAQYQAWAEELVIGGAREKEGSDFRRFCRVRLEGRARGLGLDAAGRAYRSRCDFPPPQGWDCLRETDEHFYNRSWETLQGGLRESDRCIRCGRTPRPGETVEGWSRLCGSPVVRCPECHRELLAWKDAQIEEHRREAKESARQTRKARQAEASAAGPKRRNLPPGIPACIVVDLGRSEGWRPAQVIAVRGKNLCYRLSDGREGQVPVIGRDIVWRGETAQEPG